MKPTLELIVSGTVQGVGFRWAVKQVADQIGINGSVENLADGNVKILAQGEHHQLDKLINAVKDSPAPASMVTDVSLSFTQQPAMHGFTTI